MGRIRTLKPDAFRHELLQELETKHRDKSPILVFFGLFTVSDKLGRFAWEPKQLKLDILPFVPFEMEQTLDLLRTHGFVQPYRVGGKAYGWIPSWKKHQRITGTESTAPPRYPDPSLDESGNTLESQSVSELLPEDPEPKKPRKARAPKTAEESLKLSPDLEPWFEVVRYEVWPQDKLDQIAVARERFGKHARKFSAVAVYLACRGYLKNDKRVKEGFVQNLYAFLGPGKKTVEGYVESVLPYLEAHPALKALKAPPESEDALRAVIAQDEAAHV